MLTLAGCMLAQSGLKITVSTTGDLKPDVEVPVTVTLKDASGAAVSDANVEVIATMVDMDHGEFKAPAKMVKPGVYEAKQKFMMGGNWNLKVNARKGGDSGTTDKKILVKD